MSPRKYVEMLRLGMRNLAGYPLRTLLTTLGIVLGVGSVIAMLALGAGAEQALLHEIGRLGIDNIIVNSVKPPEKTKPSEERNWIHRYGLTFKDERQIRATLPGLAEVLPVHHSRKTVWRGSRRVEAMVYAVEPRHMRVFRLETVRGRSISDADNAALARVCVIRAGLLKDLGAYEDPLDMSLLVGSEYFRVVGILEDEEFLGYAQKALAIDAKAKEIYVPYRTALQRLGTRDVRMRTGSWEASDVQLSQLVVSVQEGEEADLTPRVLLTVRMLRRILEKNHEEADYDVVVPLEALAQRRKTQEVFNIALFVIASVSLVVGGIGIANIMLATVTERTREIGIRRALGAKRRHILAQFLAETVSIAVMGGMVGVGAGLGFARGLSDFTGWRAIVSGPSIFLALAISMIVGIASGIFPATRAARLDPIAALRHE
ncbi:MAG: ABC transporter permease [Planctomycetota bacterium]